MVLQFFVIVMYKREQGIFGEIGPALKDASNKFDLKINFRKNRIESELSSISLSYDSPFLNQSKFFDFQVMASALLTSWLCAVLSLVSLILLSKVNMRNAVGADGEHYILRTISELKDPNLTEEVFKRIFTELVVGDSEKMRDQFEVQSFLSKHFVEFNKLKKRA